MNKKPELVDLGLPSGNLWMKCNLGASRETDYGYYYQFGSLTEYSGEEAKKHYSDWKICPFNDGKEYFDKEYFLKHRYKWFYKNGILKSDYDAVTQTYGEGYKIPSEKDFQELLEYTISTFIKNYKDSEINGKLFTSKINEKTLFMPFSGDIWDGSFIGIGDWCNLWSNRLGSLYSARLFNCNSSAAALYYDERHNGLTIRGIRIKDE